MTRADSREAYTQSLFSLEKLRKLRNDLVDEVPCSYADVVCVLLFGETYCDANAERHSQPIAPSISLRAEINVH